MRGLLIVVAVVVGLTFAITLWASSPVETEGAAVSSENDPAPREPDVLDLEVTALADAGLPFRLDDGFCDPFPSGSWRYVIKNDALIVESPRWSTAQWAVKMPPDWVAQFKRADRAEARKEALLRAQRLVPGDVSSAMALVFETRSDPTPDEAIAHLDVVLRSVTSRELERMRARLVVAGQLQHAYERMEFDGLTIAWDPRTIDSSHARSIVELVRKTRREVVAATGRWGFAELRSIVVYPSASEMLAVSCVPEWAGGLYDGTIRLVVDDDGKVNLDSVRHEAAHSVLQVSAPRWVREGLAQSYELDRVSASTWRRMLAQDAWIELDQLDAALIGADGRRASIAYAEALLLISKLRSCDERAISKALDGFAAGASANDIFSLTCGEQPSKANGLAFAKRMVGE